MNFTCEVIVQDLNNVSFILWYSFELYDMVLLLDCIHNILYSLSSTKQFFKLVILTDKGILWGTPDSESLPSIYNPQYKIYIAIDTGNKLYWDALASFSDVIIWFYSDIVVRILCDKVVNIWSFSAVTSSVIWLIYIYILNIWADKKTFIREWFWARQGFRTKTSLPLHQSTVSSILQ